MPHLPFRTRQPPLVARGPHRVRQAQMIHQIGGRLRRAVSRQIIRRGADHHVVGTQIFRHQIVIADIANANGQIDPLFHQIDHSVGEIQFDTHFRVALQKCGRQRGDRAAAKRRGGGDAQGAGGRRAQPFNRAFGNRDLLQHAPGLFEINASGVGQALATGIALQQPRAELRFEQRNIFPDHHRRHLQPRRRAGEAAALYHRDKRLHAAKLIHIPNSWLNEGSQHEESDMKIVIIGASGTVGRAVTEELSRRHEVIRVGRTRGDYQVDITSQASVKALFEKIGPVDAIVSASGGLYFGPLATMKDSDFNQGLQDKLLGQVRLALTGQHYLNEGGSITLISGIVAHEPIAQGVNATTVNAALEGFVRAAACELPRGIRINLISPTRSRRDRGPGLPPQRGRGAERAGV
ncbi:hypothetical protein ID866_2316 [Astraeus odoratus]|nr:hypothetical protein ID866_2316 [Astraeus odoratus]